MGNHLLNLDIGLPLDKMRQQIREHLGANPPEPTTTVLHAVRKIEHLVGNDATLADEIESLKRELQD